MPRSPLSSIVSSPIENHTTPPPRLSGVLKHCGVTALCYCFPEARCTLVFFTNGRLAILAPSRAGWARFIFWIVKSWTYVTRSNVALKKERERRPRDEPDSGLY